MGRIAVRFYAHIDFPSQEKSEQPVTAAREDSVISRAKQSGAVPERLCQARKASAAYHQSRVANARA